MLSPKAYEFSLPILYYGRIGKEAGQDFCKTIRALADTDFELKTPRPAMGYSGPEINDDKFVRKMNDTGKLIIVNQEDWLFSHSGMKVPSEDLYEKVYQKWIWTETLSKTGFGRY